MFFPSDQDVSGVGRPALLPTPGPDLSSPRLSCAPAAEKGHQTPWVWRMLQIVEKTLQATAIHPVDYVRSTRPKGLIFDNDVIKTDGDSEPWMQQALPVLIRMLASSCITGKQGEDCRGEKTLPSML